MNPLGIVGFREKKIGFSYLIRIEHKKCQFKLLNFDLKIEKMELFLMKKINNVKSAYFILNLESL